ncbi:hypothetical protein [Nonomuraea basaltis]|uniref:hypothetical protein n=1 Tax=Nonomuraea basaltis TaxID=2495887 RepID=UPI001486263F|nr:hypothetical protein [Nonomuraea basaltis]TMR88906.1 hypothetical protein EJK15_63625 [Nonomuraea basaltis]
MDGLTDLLAGRPPDEPVLLSEIRTRTPRFNSKLRIVEVLTEMDLLVDDTTAAIRCWIETRTSALPAGFAADVRAWLLVLLDGDARTRPRSPSTLYVYFGALRPHLEHWAITRHHLREVRGPRSSGQLPN